ncbi:MAG TPA: hypothetical protein VEQ65_01840, partial [Opitutus sp.]|nr:hypothetical protein [Opitutus sp.]
QRQQFRVSASEFGWCLFREQHVDAQARRRLDGEAAPTLDAPRVRDRLEKGGLKIDTKEEKSRDVGHEEAGG